jgi:hypothetical protein
VNASDVADFVAAVPETVRGRFVSRVAFGDGCWEWLACKTRDGYGQFRFEGRSQRTHRLAYAWFIGSAPEGTELDHVCRNRRCLRPDHLEPVTHRENVLRGTGSPAEQAKQTSCRRGHPLTLGTAGKRYCKTCAKAWREANRERTRITDHAHFLRTIERHREIDRARRLRRAKTKLNEQEESDVRSDHAARAA